ncbi:acyl-CoA thioester hydrolase [Candidatus Planktophila dulcis]|uniref:Acyl-CoA thioester hydrolase n=1 Tax=Candidatus Planktophila dulcis TaxID=1884914 RepID=A0AAD0E5N9_9ACTN|nr:thioesterase family protein [Candidatus Planktophila dulcis]ASY12273.1 acyl-CoA thioester hydrolase [Candidatus Planktophila dulcis]
MIFTDKQFVRWDDLDAMGHVNNATYLTYIQETRFLWLSNVEMVVARAEVDFLEPIYVGGRFVDVTLWVESIGNSSFVLAYEVIGENGVVHAKVKTVQVTISPETKKSRPLKDSEREFLTTYLKA